MDEKFDSETKSTSDDQTAASLRPIWLREQYSTVDPDLEVTYSKVSTTEKEVDPFAFLLDKKDWYILIDSIDGKKISYDKKEIKTRLRANILAGMHDKNSSAIIFTKRIPFLPARKGSWNLENKWNQKATTLAEFGKKHFAVGVLYQPIRSYAKAGLKWGAAIGIILKSIDSSIGLYQTDPFMAVLVTMGILVCFIPRFGPMSFILFLFMASRYPGTEFLLPMILGVALVGASLGCLPGMAVGGLIGWGRRRSIPRAYDAVSEPKSVIVKAVLLPFMAGCGVIFVFLFVVLQLLLPWLYNMSEKIAMQG